MAPSYRYVAIHSFDDAAKYKDEILRLFELSYDKTLSPALWDWAYLQNACGPAFIDLAYSGDELAGHYAAIAQSYRMASQSAKCLLSMTTMVHPNHRGTGLFTDLATRTYARAADAGIKAVLGFPNNNSMPGFKRRLGWTIEEDWKMLQAPVESLGKGKPLQEISQGDFAAAYHVPSQQWRLDLGAPEVLRWRASKPGNVYRFGLSAKTPVVFKVYGEGLDLLLPGEPDDHILSAAAATAAAEKLKTVTFYSRRQDRPGAATTYYFGYRAFDGSSPLFAPNLLMSDVF